MADPEVVILIGSANDWKHLQGAVDVLRKLGITFEVHVSSAHRTPVRTAELVQSAEAAGCRAFICAAGMAAHLAGVVASLTIRPVLGVPLPGGVLDGVDALLSTVQMPAGIPVATFAVGSAGARWVRQGLATLRFLPPRSWPTIDRKFERPSRLCVPKAKLRSLPATARWRLRSVKRTHNDISVGSVHGTVQD